MYLLSGKTDYVLVAHALNSDFRGYTEATYRSLSGDGRFAISGCRDRTLRVWGEAPPRILEVHTGSVGAVALSRDGRFAVSGCYDHALRVWDLTAGKNVTTVTCDGIDVL